MRIKIMQSGALINEATGERAGLFEEHDVEQKRAKFLISVGAAEPVDPEEAQDVQRFFATGQRPMETRKEDEAQPAELVDVPEKKPAARKTTAPKASK